MIEREDELLVKHFNNRGIDNAMVMNHPASLFVLFFTEMWERFSYYGMVFLTCFYFIFIAGVPLFVTVTLLLFNKKLVKMMNGIK